MMPAMASLERLRSVICGMSSTTGLEIALAMDLHRMNNITATLLRLAMFTITEQTFHYQGTQDAVTGDIKMVAATSRQDTNNDGTLDHTTQSTPISDTLINTKTDDNGDARLSGTELSGLQIWNDLNEDGIQSLRLAA